MIEPSKNPSGGHFPEELVASLRERFPQIRDAGEAAREALKKFEQEQDAKQRQYQEEVERAKAEGKPAPRPPRKEEPQAPRYKTPTLEVPLDVFREVMFFLRDDPAFRMDYLSFASAVDWKDRMECTYHLWSTEHNHEVLIKVPVDRGAPRIPTVSDLWMTAEWHEREAYDLFGVIYEGHPNLRRIMMTDDWKGHPLRKDYVYEEPEWLTEIAKMRQDEVAGIETPIGERA
jgi:NADH-quinone oxidoreductase subunit C